jgi:hypothetical protein
METIMKTSQLTSITELELFLSGNQKVAFSVLGHKTERYNFIAKTLIKLRYFTRSKKDKGVVIRYLIKMTNDSRQQITRLIKQYLKTGKINWRPSRNNGFTKKYTKKDVTLLAKMDERHDTPCGPAVKKLCERAYHVFNESEYQTLASISVAHLYNLRASDGYKKERRHFTKTQSRQIPIGVRKKPHPKGKPGYIRIDTVHQGDQDKVKGGYHINAVDEVTQFEIVASVEKINVHRPCFFAETVIDHKGKERKKYAYKDMMTPYDKLKSLPNAKQYLKPDMSFQRLDDFAFKISNNQSAEQLKNARLKLFNLI